MNPDLNNPDENSLDSAIRAALRHEPDPEQLTRLEQYWHRKSRRERLRRGARWGIAAAAAAAVIIAAFTMAKRAKPRGAVDIVETAPSQPVHDDPSSTKPTIADLPAEHEKLPAEINAGRSPTAYERLVFTARSHGGTSSKQAESAIDNAIRQLLTTSALDGRGLIVSSGLSNSEAESVLLRQLPKAAAGQRRAILQLLSVCATPRSIPALLRLAHDESLRDDSVATVEQVVGIERLAQTVFGTPDAKVRSALMRRLLASDSPAGVAGFLSLVNNATTRSEALAVAGTSRELPTDRLIDRLDGGEEPLRIAAAMVLGHVDGPEITRRLIARITEQPDASAVWLALMSSRGEMAQEFLRFAAQRPQLLGYYNNARIRYGQFASLLAKEKPACPNCPG